MAEKVNVCFECARDPFLSAEIHLHGIYASCGLCSAKRQCLPLSEVVAQVERFLGHYIREGCERRTWCDGEFSVSLQGERIEHWVSMMFGCAASEAIVESVCRSLTAYTDDTPYMKSELTLDDVGIKWAVFEDSLKHGNRFFNQHAKEYLDWLFKDIHTYSTESEALAVVRTLWPATAEPIYRARVCSTSAAVDEITEGPDSKLAAPPKEVAGEGRMNAVGVPAFYGAFQRSTCLAELRPPVGGMVVSGAFRLNRAVTVLDFGRFEEADLGPEPSYFDPEYIQKSGRKEFLIHLHNKLTVPVQRGSEKEYLISQVIAEYLATCVDPRIDGVIYKSVQEPSGSNITLFSHVVSVETGLQWELNGIRGILGPRASERPRIEYVSGSLVHHTVEGIKHDTGDQLLVDKCQVCLEVVEED